jgi:ribosome-binding protein aMBF1 (putative translation factor)
MPRPMNKGCSICGIVRTKENTYVRANGQLLNVCKPCSSEITQRNLLKKLSPEKKAERLAFYNRMISYLKGAM